MIWISDSGGSLVPLRWRMLTCKVSNPTLKLVYEANRKISNGIEVTLKLHSFLLFIKGFVRKWNVKGVWKTWMTVGWIWQVWLFHPRESQIFILVYIFHVWFPKGIRLCFLLDRCNRPRTVSPTPCILLLKGEMTLQFMEFCVEGKGTNWNVPHNLIIHMITLSCYKVTPTIIKESRLLVVEYDCVALIYLGKFNGFPKGLHYFHHLAYLL